MMRCFTILVALGLFACKEEGESIIDADKDGVAFEEDCDDNDAKRFPGNEEICNGIDDDCDGFVDSADEGIAPELLHTLFVDNDSDGFGRDKTIIACPGLAGTADNNLDCDDQNSGVYPGALEICNSGVDDDCDGLADDLDPNLDEGSVLTFYFDADGDGFGDDDLSMQQCAAPSGSVEVGGDCDDGDADVNPDADEVCDRVDNNCDGLLNDNDPNLLDSSKFDYYADNDGDYAGDPADVIRQCLPIDGRVRNDLDCDDTNPEVNPLGVEICDGIDNDCDPLTLEDDSPAASQYEDADLDGFGAFASAVLHNCTLQPGYSFSNRDCDDTNSEIHPGATEVCDENHVDEDCNGLADDADPNTQGTSIYWWDADGDGYGDSRYTVEGCGTNVSGYALAGIEDCEVNNPDIFPGQDEECNGHDDDCDGEIDEAGAVGEMNLYADLDGDGWGSEIVGYGCANTELYGEPGLSGDCDDNDPSVHPEAEEICDSLGVDEDCNGLTNDEDPGVLFQAQWWFDLDEDSFGDPERSVLSCAVVEGYIPAGLADCDDSNPFVNPGMEEVCDDSAVDEDCDGVVNDAEGEFALFLDLDGDGYGDPEQPILTCEDAPMAVANSSDCDDSEPAVHPGAQEVCDPFDVDEDCSGSSDDDDEFVSLASLPPLYADLDEDGYGVGEAIFLSCEPPQGYANVAGDCDDTNSELSPGAPEICDGVDNDCDHRADDADDVDASGANYWLDLDQDGQGTPDGFGRCLSTPGYVSNSDDCDDTNSAIFTGAPVELCDGVANDCANSTWTFEDEPAVTHHFGGASTASAVLPDPLLQGDYDLCSDVEITSSTTGFKVNFFGHGDVSPVLVFPSYFIFFNEFSLSDIDILTRGDLSFYGTLELENSVVTGEAFPQQLVGLTTTTLTNTTFSNVEVTAYGVVATGSVFEATLLASGESTVTDSTFICDSSRLSVATNSSLIVENSIIDGCSTFVPAGSSATISNSDLINAEGESYGDLVFEDSTIFESFAGSIFEGGALEFSGISSTVPLKLQLNPPVSNMVPYTYVPESSEPFNLVCDVQGCLAVQF